MQREKEEDFPPRVSLCNVKISVAREGEREKTGRGGKSAERGGVLLATEAICVTRRERKTAGERGNLPLSLMRAHVRGEEKERKRRWKNFRREREEKRAREI